MGLTSEHLKNVVIAERHIQDQHEIKNNLR